MYYKKVDPSTMYIHIFLGMYKFFHFTRATNTIIKRRGLRRQRSFNNRTIAACSANK